MNEANPLPDETLLVLPAEWQADLLPRRGVRPGEPFELDAEAPAYWRKRLTKQEAALRTALAAHPNPDAVAYLDGEPNALGAGLIAAMAAVESPSRNDTKLHPMLDAWIEEHGLPFAIAAAVAFMSYESTRGMTNASFGSFIEYDNRRVRERPLSSMSGVLFLNRDLNLLRGLLADAAEPEFEAAESTVDLMRNSPTRKYFGALFFPDRTDWVDEAAVEVAKESWNGLLSARLAHSVSSRDQLAAMGLRAIESHEQHTGLITPLLDSLGVAVLPLLTAPTRHHLEPEYVQERLRAIALLPHDAAAAYLVERIADPFVFEQAANAATRFPVRTLRAVAAHAPAAQPARVPLLASLVARTDPRALDALTEADRAALTELESRWRPAPEAPEADLPELLVRPPWTVKRPKRKPVVVEGLEPSGEAAVLWNDGEEAEYRENAEFYRRNISDWDRHVRHQSWRNDAWCELLVYAPDEIAEARLNDWDGDLGSNSDDRATALAQGLLARFEAAVAHHVVTFLGAKPRLGAVMGPIRSPEAARLAAHWYANLKSAKEHGAAWLDRHGPAAAELLVPGALAKSKTDRASAEVALLRIAEIHGADAVLDAAAAYGDKARTAIAALLEAGTAGTLPSRVPNPGWLEPARLPQILLRDRGSALPEASMRYAAVVMGIAVGIDDDPRLAEVAATCDRDSLRECSWAVFEQWLASGAPSADRWALSALRFFGDDTTVARLTPMIKAWPGQNQHHRAVTGLRVLGGIGSEEALRAMQHISRRAKFKAIKAEAAQQIQVIAKSLGLTGEQLADRLLPDFGLGSDGVLVLDYGPRKFKIAFDEQLRPYVTDEDGKPRKALPKPGAKDDPELAGAAYKRFADLKKELRTVAVDQVRRLEAAMINARTWSRDEFEEHLHGHPLMRYLTRRMIWLAQTGETRSTFRIAEDGTYGDAEDDAVELPEDAVIRLAHPIDMTAEERGAWARLLADYEILQPFEQLARPIMAFTETEAATGRLSRFEGAVVPPGAILGLTKHGWVRGKPQDNGTEFGFHFPLPAGGYVAVELNPGLQIGMGADVEDQRLERVFLTDTLDDYYRAGRGFSARIDPVIASEVLAALDRLTTTDWNR